MNIKLPKGFLDKLSKSTRKELVKAASNFEVECEIDAAYTQLLEFEYSSPYQLIGPYGIQTLTPKPKNIKQSAILNVQVATMPGFSFTEGDFLPEGFAKAYEIEQKATELDKLKNSLGTIKTALGNV